MTLELCSAFLSNIRISFQHRCSGVQLHYYGLEHYTRNSGAYCLTAQRNKPVQTHILVLSYYDKNPLASRVRELHLKIYNVKTDNVMSEPFPVQQVKFTSNCYSHWPLVSYYSSFANGFPLGNTRVWWRKHSNPDLIVRFQECFQQEEVCSPRTSDTQFLP